MSLAAVFLDLGNTLLVERISRATLYADEAGRHGVKVSPGVMQQCMARALAGLPQVVDGDFRFSDGWFRAFQRRIFLDELGLALGSFEELSAGLFERFEDAATYRLFPGTRELLASLRKRDLTVGLVSNWSARLPRLLEGLGLSAAFDLVLGSAELELEKPDSAIFEEASRRAGVPPEACLHAGDHVENDAQAALRAGFAAVLVDHSGRLAESERPVCPIVGSLPELEDLILERLP